MLINDLYTNKKTNVAEEASPMIKPPANRFDNKQEAFDHAKQYGGKVFKSTYTDPNTGIQNIVFVVKKEQGMAEDDDAVAAFLARGGEVQRLKPARPRKGERWQGSAHIGAAGGSGTKGRVSGLGANTGKSGKPVVTAEQGVAEDISRRGFLKGAGAAGLDPDKKYTIKKSYTMSKAGVEKSVWYIMDGDFVVDATDLRRDAKYYADKWNAAEKDSKGVAEGSLNELSKDTLKSYAKKAVPDMQASQKRSEIEAGKAASTKDDKTAKTHYDAAKQARDRTEKRMAGISGAIKRVTKQGVAEASLGDYGKKAAVSRAMAQTNRFFDRDDAAKVAAADRTIANRTKGLASADARRQPYTPPPQDAEKMQRDLTARYPNIDELVAAAEQRRDPNYDYAEGNAYYDGREAEQNYQKLKQIQRVIQGLNESLQRTQP